MTKEVKMKEKSIYGNVLTYPNCETSEKFAHLIQKMTFSERDITIIKMLGYKVTIKKLS